MGQVVWIDVQFDLDAVGEVLAGLVAKDVAAGDQKQALVTLEEEAAGIGQSPRPDKGEDAGGGKKYGFCYQGSPAPPRKEADRSLRSRRRRAGGDGAPFPLVRYTTDRRRAEAKAAFSSTVLGLADNQIVSEPVNALDIAGDIPGL